MIDTEKFLAQLGGMLIVREGISHCPVMRDYHRELWLVEMQAPFPLTSGLRTYVENGSSLQDSLW